MALISEACDDILIIGQRDAANVQHTRGTVSNSLLHQTLEHKHCTAVAPISWKSDLDIRPESIKCACCTITVSRVERHAPPKFIRRWTAV